MNRTDMDAATLARSLRRMAGDGGMEWCCEPIRTSVLLDVADLLDDTAKLREQGARLFDKTLELGTENAKLRQALNETLVRLVAANEVTVSDYMDDEYCDLLREMGIEVGDG